jgi:hypothetical protein
MERAAEHEEVVSIYFIDLICQHSIIILYIPLYWIVLQPEASNFKVTTTGISHPTQQ